MKKRSKIKSFFSKFRDTILAYPRFVVVSIAQILGAISRFSIKHHKLALQGMIGCIGIVALYLTLFPLNPSIDERDKFLMKEVATGLKSNYYLAQKENAYLAKEVLEVMYKYDKNDYAALVDSIQASHQRIYRLINPTMNFKSKHNDFLRRNDAALRAVLQEKGGYLAGIMVKRMQPTLIIHGHEWVSPEAKGLEYQLFRYKVQQRELDLLEHVHTLSKGSGSDSDPRPHVLDFEETVDLDKSHKLRFCLVDESKLNLPNYNLEISVNNEKGDKFEKGIHRIIVPDSRGTHFYESQFTVKNLLTGKERQQKKKVYYYVE